MMDMVAEIALSLVEARSLGALFAGGSPSIGRCGEVLGWPARPLAEDRAERRLDRLHFGSEFCETLLPGEAQLRLAASKAAGAGIGLSLVTPAVSDAGLRRITALLPLLPAGSEVIANDWGVLRLLRENHSAIIPVAGRILCKMIKDPRLPSADWARLYPHGIHSRPFSAVLERLGVRRIEMDVPPFADAADFRGAAMAISVHSPYGFSVRGRSCRLGSLAQTPERKFMVSQACRKECLVYVDTLTREQVADGVDLPTFQRGHTMFYRHSAKMTAALRSALAEGYVDRLILAGDWNEDRRSDQPTE